MTYTRTGGLIAGLAAVALMGFGCNPIQSVQDKVSQKVGEAAVGAAVNQASGGKVSADVANNQMVFRDNKTGDMMAFGEDVKLPDDFPKDIPIYAGVKVVGVTISKQTDKGTSVTMKSTDAVQVVVKWYASQMTSAGFTEDSSMSAGSSEIRSYSKGNVKIALTVATDTDPKNEKGSVITLIRTEESAS